MSTDIPPKASTYTIALAGNPNSGKTTIFNNLTGTRQKVGNWPGVTVEKKEGRLKKFGYDLKIIDLPGTYSLTPFSIEEIVARDFVLEESPDVVIDIIDASNLERSLYLATQLRELDCKVLFALNMADVARVRGIRIDAEKLSELLNVPVVFTVGNKNEGIDALLKRAVELAESTAEPKHKRRVQYSKDIERAISSLQNEIEEAIPGGIGYNPRWTAIKLIENDNVLRKRLAELGGEHGPKIAASADAYRRQIADLYNEEPEMVMTDERYGFIAGIVKETVSVSTHDRVDLSRNIDLVLTNRFLGFPIFLFFIWAMFQATFSLGEYPVKGIELLVSGISHAAGLWLPSGWVKDLLVDGIIAGVGSVVVFLPNILILFFCIALFEDTGYMSRAAFLMDRIMHLIGLHGKSFIPMLMGFGCNVPAIMATRTLEARKDRLLTILITPFMSCSAKLPVYIILAGTFFATRAGNVIFAIYLLGIAVSIVSGRLFRSTLFKGVDAPFVMELPPYRAPMLKSLLIHMWDRSKIFLRKMGGVILVGSVVIWVLSSFPGGVQYTKDYEKEAFNVRRHYDAALSNADTASARAIIGERDEVLARLEQARGAEQMEHSYMGRIGKALEPFFSPLGIDWRGGIALACGFVAKEIVVSTLGVLYAVDEAAEPEALKKALKASGMTPLSAGSMMVFVLLYLPCLATVSAIRRETSSIGWMAFSIFYSTAVAWLMTFVVYQGGKLLGLD